MLVGLWADETVGTKAALRAARWALKSAAWRVGTSAAKTDG